MADTAILCFSGTGNGLDIAQRIQGRIEADAYRIPLADLQALGPYRRLILVSPIYSFGLPIPVKECIGRLDGHCEIHVVLHYGGFSGNAAHYARMFFQRCGVPVRTIQKMRMPENYTLVATVPQPYIKWLLKKADGQVGRILRRIQSGVERLPRKNIFAFCDGAHEKNAALWHTLPQGFTIDASCVGCGACAAMCPVKNIAIKDGRPAFSDACVNCLACYHRCPQEAIQYGEKTAGRPRYSNPAADFTWGTGYE